jgi:alanine racemase
MLWHHPFLRFDVQRSKNRESKLEDKATVMVMGLVQDEDMEWVANNVGFCFFDKARLTKAKQQKKLDKSNYTLK